MVGKSGRRGDVGDFRSEYLTYAQLTAKCRQLAADHPEIVELSSIGRSTEGRDLWLLTIRPPNHGNAVRPAVWIDGNMHATEVAGSSAALALAEEFIALHAEGGRSKGAAKKRPALAHLGEPELDVLRGLTVYVLPRLSPDGAEVALGAGRYTRSSPTDSRLPRNHARWVAGDLDGDGCAGLMRVVDPTGELVESSICPGLLVPRRPDDVGPFYKLYPEGEIENFDGVTIPDPWFLGDNATDFNRNFSWHWRPEPEQAGAGDHPGSAPETRAVMEFAVKHPEIFVWMNFHTYGGVFIRPFGHAPDHKMNQNDLAVWKQIGVWNEALTGYPTVSGFEEFLYEPDKPLHGDLTEYAYHQRGAVAYVCEIWDLFAQLGLKRGKKFVDYYFQIDREELEILARWDKKHNKGRIVGKWKKFTHPQLGMVEIGGYKPLIGISNPPYEKLSEVLTKQCQAFLRVAGLVPRLEVNASTKAAGDTTQIDVVIRNQGYLPTYGMEGFRDIPINEPLVLEASASDAEILSPSGGRADVGHLRGWGRGIHGQLVGISVPWTSGSVSTRQIPIVVRGRGTVRVRVGNCRVGWYECSVKLGRQH